MYESLFSKGKIGSLELRNRIVMTPMGNYLNNEDATISDEVIAFYAARAKGGVGLIITEVTRVNDEHGKADGRQLSAANDKYIPGLKKLADIIHKYDGRIFLQLHHPGRQGFVALNGNKPMLAPSAIPCKVVQQETRAMTMAEVEGLVQDFINAAVRARTAGIDGVELHGAHGYLINQFLSPYTNKRTDKYGGSFENRMRFLEEIILGIREKCGKDFPLIVRLSVDEFLRFAGIPEDGIVLEAGVQIAKRLEEISVDGIDVSAGIYETMNVSWEPTSFQQGWKLYLAEAVKKEVKIPVITAAVIREPAFADKVIAQGSADFIGSARTHYGDPEWSNKAKENRVAEARLCISCLHCMESLFAADATGHPMECAINIQTGAELEYSDFKEDGDGRTVVVIGAGPAGLEAARVLALRKFKPIVFEKSGQIGGQLELANKPPLKEKISWLIRYFTVQANKLGIEIRLNTAPSIETLTALNPYAVFVSQGSTPIIPRSIPGIDAENVLTPAEILTAKQHLRNKKVAVVGSGMTGLETAELLAVYDNEVTIFEMADNIGPGLFFQNLIDIQQRLNERHVKMFTKHKLTKIENSILTFEVLPDCEKQEYSFDYVVVSLGVRPNSEMVEQIKEKFARVYLVGDASKPGRIRNAIETGFKAAYNL